MELMGMILSNGVLHLVWCSDCPAGGYADVSRELGLHRDELGQSDYRKSLLGPDPAHLI